MPAALVPDSFASDLARLFGGHGLSAPPEAFARLNAYALLLYRWNKRFNLTRISPKGALTELFLDSAMALPFLPETGTGLDLGSGAGFPGLVLSILRPDLSVACLERVGKKAEFLRAVVRDLGLPRVKILQKSWPQSTQDLRFDWISVRAVYSDKSDLAPARAQLAPGGKLLLWAAAGETIPLKGFSVTERTYRLPGLSRERKIWIGTPEAETDRKERPNVLP